MTKTQLLLAGLVCLPACFAESPEQVGTTGRPIINGQPATSAHASTVAIHQRSGSSVSISPFCSGTLVDDTTVVTAAHCLDAAMGGPSFKTRTPSSIAIYIGDDPAADMSAANVYWVADTIIHPSYDRRRLRNDIAIVKLADTASGAATTPPLPTSLGFTSADEGVLALDFAGFGYSDLNKTQIGVKLHNWGTLDALGCTMSGCPSSSPPETQISYSQSEGSEVVGPCNGDSGGPAYVDRGGTRYLGGVTSYGDAGCDVYGVSTRVDAFEGWVASHMGALPPPPDCSADGVCNAECSDDPDCGGGGQCTALPIGASCSADSECCSNKCKGPPGGKTCK